MTPKPRRPQRFLAPDRLGRWRAEERGGTASDDDDDIPEARVISEEPKEEKPKYDTRSDFMRGFAEGRESTQAEPVQKPHVLQQRIDKLEKLVDELLQRVERLEGKTLA